MGSPSGEGLVPGKSVEVTSARTQNMKVFSNPDGSHVAELSMVPLHYQDPDTGAWTDIDSSIVADPSRPGWYRSKANSWTARFGPTPQVEFDSASGGVQTMTPVGGATVAPEMGLEPGIIVYPGVWPNVNLQYTVTSTGVEEDIVVTGPSARSSYDFSTGTTTYAVSAEGGMTPLRAARDAAALSSPMVRDANDVPLTDASPTLSPLSLAGGSGVRVAVDPNWTPPSYPYVIDPSFSVSSTNMKSFKADGYSCSGCFLQVGNPNASGAPTDYWRAVGYFDYSSVLGDAISNATTEVNQLAAGTSNNYAFSVWVASAYSYSGATGYGEQVAASADTGCWCTSQALSQAYNGWIESGAVGGALGFLGQETPSSYTYKQFDDYVLLLTYWTFPTSPTPTGSITNGSTYHGPLTPTLTANPATNADHTPLQYIFQVSTDSTFKRRTAPPVRYPPPAGK